MYMQVDKPRRYHFARNIINFVSFIFNSCTDFYNLAVFYEHICHCIEFIFRIDYASAFEQNFHACFPPVSTKVKSAMRTATPFCTSS